MLPKVYRHSSDDLARFQSIVLLSDTLTKLRNRGFELSLVVSNDIKQLLISCFKILRIIVSFVAFDVVMLDNGRWDELGDCILSLASSDPFRAFNVFLDLPPIYGGFINRFLYKLKEEVYMVLFHPEQDEDEDWSLALETAIKLGIQLLDSEMRNEILDNVLKSANALVSIGMERFLQGAHEHLVRYLAKEVKMCKWSSDQCGFVAEFAFRITGIGTRKRETAKEIYQMVTKLDKYGLGDDRDLYYNLTTLSAFDVLRAFAVTEHNDRARETEIDKLLLLLIFCLKEKGMPENTFRILGQVVFHVALEAFSYRRDQWFENIFFKILLENM